jgi:hypothetical protein
MTKVFRGLVLMLGITIAAIGIALNEGGVDFGRTLFIAGVSLTLLGVVALVWPRAQVGPDPSEVLNQGQDALASIAQYWNMRFVEGCASGMVKGREVEVRLHADGLAVNARAVRSLDMGLTVQRGGKTLGDARKEYSTGDAVFDAEYCVRVDEPERAENLLSDRLRKQLLTAHASLDDSGVELIIPPCDADELAEQVRLACKVAGELDRASPKVRCAEPLNDTRAAWLEFAEQQKLASTDTPLAVWGQIDNFEVQVVAVRDAFHQFHFELTANFPEPLDRGMALKPASASTRFDRSGEPIGHPAFDKLFSLTATDPTDAARLAGPETRDAMLKLRDSGVQLRGTDRGLWAWMGFNRSNFGLVPIGLSSMVKIAERIRVNAARFPRHRK